MFKWLGNAINKVKSFLGSFLGKKKNDDLLTIPKPKKWDLESISKAASIRKINATTKRKEKALYKDKATRRLASLILKTTGKLDKELSEKLTNFLAPIMEDKRSDKILWNIYESLQQSEYNYFTNLLSSQNGNIDFNEASESFYNTVVNAYNEFKGIES